MTAREFRAVSAGKISLHLHTGDNAAACVRVYEDCAQAGTPIPLAMVINDPSLVDEIKRVSPDTFAVLRDGVVGGQDSLPLTQNNPAANIAAGRARFAQRYAVCKADAYQIANEHYHKSHPAWMVEAMAWFYVGAMQAAEAMDTFVLVGDFGVGGPEDEHLPLLTPMLTRAEANGHPLNYHGYCQPNVYDIALGAEWFAMRWRRIVAGYPALRVIIGECGGYYDNGPDIMGMMKMYQPMLAPFANVIGAAVFTAKAAEPWKSGGFNFDPHLNEYATWFKSLGKGTQMPQYTSPVDPSTNNPLTNGWFDATGYAKLYSTSAVAKAYHTGLDLNCNTPSFDSDAHKPVYAIADGTVTAVRKYSTWGWIVVIRHMPTGGPYCFARYAHVENIVVTEGQQVKRGQQIASVGNANGVQPYHLHFDISLTDILYYNPAHWPGLNLAELKEHYVDPAVFLRGLIAISTPAQTFLVSATDALRLRALPNTTCSTITIFPKDITVEVVAYNASWYKRVNGGYLSRQYAKPVTTTPTPQPTPIVVYVDASDGLNVRSGPGTNYPIITTLRHGDAVIVTEYDATWYKRVAGGYIFREYTTLSKPTPPAPTWQPPISATMRGLHGSAGGWAIRTEDLSRDLDLVRRNNIKFMLIAAYEPNQQFVIGQLRSAGVEQFIIRACVHGVDNLEPMKFINLTLPILEQYAAALGGTQDMLIALGNEPNLVREGWGATWKNGTEFAAWWRLIADVYRREFYGCKIGFPALSPGGDVVQVRTDEARFATGAQAAIKAADWVGVHYYWERADGSDINPPSARWRSWFAGKPIIGTEVGPADHTEVTSAAVTESFAAFAAIGVPAVGWLLDGAGAWSNAAWNTHNIQA